MKKFNLLWAISSLFISSFAFAIDKSDQLKVTEEFFNKRIASNIKIHNAGQLKKLTELKRDTAKAEEEALKSKQKIKSYSKKTEPVTVEVVDNDNFKKEEIFGETFPEPVQPTNVVLPKIIKIVGKNAHLLGKNMAEVVVKKGETIDGFLVKNVYRNSVEITENNKTYTVSIDW